MKAMTRNAVAGLLATAAFASAPAFAQCTVVNNDIEAVAGDTSTRSVYHDQIVRDLRRLRDAAHTLAAYGQEDACETVAAAIQDLANDPQAAYEGMQQGREEGIQLSNADMSWEEIEQARMAEAQPLTERFGTLRATELTGIDVRDSSGETVGEIDDILFGSDGEAGYAIVTYGGFLGLGEEQAAIPMDKLRIAPDESVVFASVSRSQIEDAPNFERGQFDWIDDTSWRQSNDSYFSAL